ncbi:MAG TPA: gene transfer agent family protein [Thermohalobaculum sp.]|nr:gene transfer agent family protein [Thermohalobaculum sp.]
MANPERGEVELVVDGRPRVMRLTLGALAELESALEVGSLVALAERFEGGDVSARELTALLAAGLRGAGEDFTEAELAEAEIGGGAVGAMKAGLRLLEATFR